MGKITSETIDRPDSSLKERVTYTYDPAGYLLLETGYAPYGTVTYTIAYTNVRGHLTQTQYHHADPDSAFPPLDKKTMYEYNKHGEKTESREYWNDSLIEEIHFHYDARSKLVKAKHNFPGAAGSTNFEIKYDYDDNANLRSESKFQPTGHLKTKAIYEYTVDAKKNWTEMSRKEFVLKNQHVTSFQRSSRDITYY